MKIIFILLGFLFFTTVNAADFTLTSPSLKPDTQIPILYTCDGKNISPKLTWSNPPANTVSYALVLSSPDSVVGVYYNWIIYNIPPTQTSLDEAANKDLPDDIMNASNTAGDDLYRGPCPPDTGLHHYVFELFALNSTLDLSNTDNVEETLRTIDKHTIKSTKLTVLFNH
jgi:Raf kinase inhibitor-like YbhB/YbcL family protein